MAILEFVKPFALADEAYAVCYPNPIRLKTGEPVTIEKWETNPDWKGWAFCVDMRGIKGWVSEKYLQVKGNFALVTSSYDATELAVEKGEVLQLHREEFGWAWVENSKGTEGWVPLSVLSYKFTPMTETDLPLLFRWASEPHVKRWWNTEENWEDFRDRYVANIQSDDSFPFIVHHQGKPIGYINGWFVESDQNFRDLFPECAIGTDQFLGEPELIGRGHGSKFVRAFTEWLLNRGAPFIMTDPDASNGAAIRCYEKAGFTSVKNMETTDGPILLMEKRK